MRSVSSRGSSPSPYTCHIIMRAICPGRAHTGAANLREAREGALKIMARFTLRQAKREIIWKAKILRLMPYCSNTRKRSVKR